MSEATEAMRAEIELLKRRISQLEYPLAFAENILILDEEGCPSRVRLRFGNLEAFVNHGCAMAKVLLNMEAARRAVLTRACQFTADRDMEHG